MIQLLLSGSSKQLSKAMHTHRVAWAMHTGLDVECSSVTKLQLSALGKQLSKAIALYPEHNESQELLKQLKQHFALL